MSTIDHLVYMANQIARELAGQQPRRAVAATFDHLRSFWDPRMRQAIVAYLEEGGEQLSADARGAVALLRDDAVAAARRVGTMRADRAAAGANADRSD